MNLWCPYKLYSDLLVCVQINSKKDFSERSTSDLFPHLKSACNPYLILRVIEVLSLIYIIQATCSCGRR
jgi:hypothetical protein